MKALALCLGMLVCGATHAQQSGGWGNLDALLMGALTQSGQAEAAFWMPDAADPQQARRSIGIAYEYIQGSAGNVGIAVGYFVRATDGGWAFAGDVQGVFGQMPRDIAFGAATAELTTSTLGPNDARCCPSATTRWRIDLTTLQAQALR